MTATARSRPADASSARSRPRWALLGVALLAALIPALALAKQSDRDQPLNYTSKYTEAYQTPNGISTLRGDVVITQGSLRMTGALAKIHLDANMQIARIVVTGSPAHIQQLDDSGNLMTGDAATLDYDNIHGIAVLTGNAVVTQQGRGQFNGDKLTYNTQTSQITGESSSDGMVHGTFLPRPRTPEQQAREAARSQDKSQHKHRHGEAIVPVPIPAPASAASSAPVPARTGSAGNAH